MKLFLYEKAIQLHSWPEDGSVVNSIGFFSRWPRFDSQNTHANSQLSVPEDLTYPSSLCRYQACMWCTDKTLNPKNKTKQNFFCNNECHETLASRPIQGITARHEKEASCSTHTILLYWEKKQFITEKVVGCLLLVSGSNYPVLI